MPIVNYYKIKSRWYLDLPTDQDEESDPEILEQIGGFHDFLELAAGENSSVILRMCQEYFEGADVIQLTGSCGEKTGGYYHLERFEGAMVYFEFWINPVHLHMEEELPEKIYLQRVELP